MGRQQGRDKRPFHTRSVFSQSLFSSVYVFFIYYSLPLDQKTIKTYGITMVTIITGYKTACKLWNKTNRPEQPWLPGWLTEWLPSAIKLFEPDWRNALEAAVAVTTHERIRLCVLSPLYLMVMDKLSVAYHLMLRLGVWCFSRVMVCWADRFGLLIAVWWFWYVGCVEQVKSFMHWRLQIAFSCPSLPHYSSGSFDVWINQ